MKEILYRYINDCRDVFCLKEVLKNQCAKKALKGVELNVDYLANCSSMKTIIREGCKKCREYDNYEPTKEDRCSVAYALANEIISTDNYINNKSILTIMKTNELIYRKTKTYVENGKTYRIIAKIELGDKLNTGVCSFKAMGEIYEKAGNGRWKDYMGGCCHNNIVEHFPELSMYVKLHLCAHTGEPLFPIENGMYILECRPKKVAMNYLRINESEYDKLCVIAVAKDKLYFKYLLYRLGIVERWKDEADSAIKELERLTGNHWVNPYTHQEHILAPISEEEAYILRERLSDGYYNDSAIQERIESAHAAVIAEREKKIIANYESKIAALKGEMKVKLEVVHSGISSSNFIYYTHTNTIVFNWMSGSDRVTKEEYEHFVTTANYDNMPEGIKFEFKE